ncbi:unnamed protein product [Penicillium salamii]|uniref:F-box domain-containing protein n=1 Tax=Penicillium salamii TaxID=1612424 RepID=A0A9W4K1G6_9EURO|nr:unnamed protein product [Penicillium salamii]CAG8336233.1 unnamed protein product [Penicillium salamii]CAG8338532.1 unnamed protein product [Penicillium salamii]CAG8387628.1 unnamed protein product [Penicillium salamii]CAG8395683.1 unnamed protein product [Penicillium salamii]
MSHLLNLPSKLLARTFFNVDSSSFKSLHHSCRFISQLATDQLFKTVHLQPSKTSQNGLQEILNNPNLRRIPRKIYIDTVDESLNYDDEEEQKWPQGWDNLVPQVKELPRLNAAVLCFDKGFTSDSEDEDYPHYTDFPQTPQFRFHAMHKLFSLLESLRHPIQDLGIRNLQADNPKDPKTLAKMGKVLSGLLSLRLSITSETNDAAPEHDLEYPEIRKFFKELPSTWLSPAAPSLQHLSLCSREYSGFYPDLDLTNLFFPRLKTLSLGNFCFFHDGQIDWILKHGDTLEEIYFDDCAILYDFGMMEENVDACALPRDTLVRREGDESLYGSFEKRWHHIFDLFAEKLPKLRHFRIGRSDWSPDIPFEQERDIKVGLYYNRYMCCYDGWGPSSYMEGEDPKELAKLENEWRPSPECDDEDRAALRKLLAKLGQSVQESYSNGHPGGRIVFHFGGKRITVTKDTLLNQIRPTVYRLELEEPHFGLPGTVIVKQQKDEQEAEFCAEISAYKKLQELQGTVLPTLFGEGSFNGRPALILSEIKGITLREFAKLGETSIEENTLRCCLENAFQELYKYGAEHFDLNLGNFLVCDNVQVVIIDLEEIEFPDRQKAWENSVNLGSVNYLMSRFRDVRYPRRAPSPVLYSMPHTGASDDRSGSEMTGPCYSMELMS